mgnify:CR=1 FL=1
MTRIPKVFRIGPFRVAVVQLPPGKLAEALDEEEELEEDRSLGGWVVEDMTIYLNRTLLRAKKFEVFFHEVAHAAIDFARMEIRDGSN